MSADHHAVARCRWCLAAGRDGFFIRQFGWQWRCEHDECFERCVHYAIRHRQPQPGKSEFFYLPLPLQVETEEAPWKRTLVWGAAGISKSFGLRMALYRQCQAIAGAQVLLLRCTLDQLRKNHLQFMDAEADVLGGAKFVGSYPMHMKFDNGSRLYAGYCDDLADIGQHLGPEWDRVAMEEAGLFLPKALEEIPARDRGSSVAREAMAALHQFTGRTTLNANPGGRGWRYCLDFYVDKAPDPDEYPHYQPEFYGNITGGIPDNPYLSEHYARETLGGLNRERYEQLAHGRKDIFEGQFFGEFNPAIHVVRP